MSALVLSESPRRSGAAFAISFGISDFPAALLSARIFRPRGYTQEQLAQSMFSGMLTGSRLKKRSMVRIVTLCNKPFPGAVGKEVWTLSRSDSPLQPLALPSLPPLPAVTAMLPHPDRKKRQCSRGLLPGCYRVTAKTVRGRGKEVRTLSRSDSPPGCPPLLRSFPALSVVSICFASQAQLQAPTGSA